MQFPLWLEVGGVRLHPHWVFEALAYLVGFQWYLLRRRRMGDPIESDSRWWIVAAAIVGAALGSKILVWLTDPAATWAHRTDVAFLLGGKTIVGGLVGGWGAVEAMKKHLGVTRSTGDLFAPPLALGVAVGRIGCFLTGLPDNTYGVATTLPWGVDFGDGVPRHPTQLYEVLFLLFVATFLLWFESRPHQNGAVFRAFMVAYFSFRFLVEFIKPGVPILGLSILQWASLFVLVYYAPQIPKLLARPQETPHA